MAERFICRRCSRPYESKGAAKRHSATHHPGYKFEYIRQPLQSYRGRKPKHQRHKKKPRADSDSPVEIVDLRSPSPEPARGLSGLSGNHIRFDSVSAFNDIRCLPGPFEPSVLIETVGDQVERSSTAKAKCAPGEKGKSSSIWNTGPFNSKDKGKGKEKGVKRPVESSPSISSDSSDSEPTAKRRMNPDAFWGIPSSSAPRDSANKFPTAAFPSSSAPRWGTSTNKLSLAANPPFSAPRWVTSADELSPAAKAFVAQAKIAHDAQLKASGSTADNKDVKTVPLAAANVYLTDSSVAGPTTVPTTMILDDDTPPSKFNQARDQEAAAFVEESDTASAEFFTGASAGATQAETTLPATTAAATVPANTTARPPAGVLGVPVAQLPAAAGAGACGGECQLCRTVADVVAHVLHQMIPMAQHHN